MEYSTNILGNQGTSTIALPDFGYNTITGDKSGLKAGRLLVVASSWVFSDETNRNYQITTKRRPRLPRR